MIEHPLQPIYTKDSKILILGSFPSVKSREANFYYSHPANRFWKILPILYQSECLDTIEEKKQFLYNNNIALYDVIQQCTITGSSDSSIKDVIVNDISDIISKSKITKIYTNGSMAHKLYQKYMYPKTKMEDIALPSSSPANAKESIETLCLKWKQIVE